MRATGGEKGVDTQICCDALELAAHGKLDRLFLYTNDADFIPLCETLRHLGVNIHLHRLFGAGVNRALVKNCDVFTVFEASDIPAVLVPDPETEREAPAVRAREESADSD